MNFAHRLKQIRTQKGLSKMQLSEVAGVHHVQIGRYESKGAMPSADVLAKLSNALDVSTEYLLNGSKDNLADDTLSDKELLSQFKKVEAFSSDKKIIVKELLDAFILKTNLTQQLSI